MKTVGHLILMATICVVIFWVFMALRPANAQCTYRMNDVGRPHGYLSGPCNGSALNLAGAYPSRSNSTPQTNGNARGCVGNCPMTRIFLTSIAALSLATGTAHAFSETTTRGGCSTWDCKYSFSHRPIAPCQRLAAQRLLDAKSWSLRHKVEP